jgi:hypothetical protein
MLLRMALAGPFMRDPRVFRPDATCYPFLIECMRNNDASFLLAKLRIPQNRVAVIWSFHATESAGLDNKRLSYGFVAGDPHLDGAVPEESRIGVLNINGALAGVEQFGDANDLPVPGWLQFSSLNSPLQRTVPSRPYRVIITSNDLLHFITMHNVTVPRIPCGFSGWHFNPQEPPLPFHHGHQPGVDLTPL